MTTQPGSSRPTPFTGAPHLPLTSRPADDEHQEHADTGRCQKCGVAFDPNDTRFIDSTRRHHNTPFCKGCHDACHDSEIADHFCVIDRWHHGGDYRQP